MVLRGSTAVVTGGSSGIGAATARALAGGGAKVVLLGRDVARLAAVATDIRQQGGTVDYLAADLQVPAAVAGVAKQILTTATPDMLINCAGAGRWLPISDTSAEEAASMIAAPYLAAFNLTRELLPTMRARRSGHIVNVTSVAARLAWPGAVAYTAARAAMEGFTWALRADLHGTGIGVTLAMFGTVESPYWEHNPGSRERLPVAAGRISALTPDDAANAIVRGILRGERFVLRPRGFRWLFLLNALSPQRTEDTLCSRGKASKI